MTKFLLKLAMIVVLVVELFALETALSSRNSASAAAPILLPCGIITANTTLTADCAAPMTIAADNIRVDLNGHRVLGDHAEDGIDVLGHRNVRISNGFVLFTRAGVNLAGSNHCRLDKLNSHGNTFGILFNQSTDNRVADSDLSGNNYAGPYLTAQSNRNQIIDVVSNNNTGDGVVFDFGSSNNILASSDVSHNGRFGIYFYGFAPAAFPNIPAAGSNRIEGNSVTYNGASGMIPSANNTVRGNFVAYNSGNGIWAIQGNNTIQENLVGRNGGSGIVVSGTGNTIEANVSIANAGDGISAGTVPNDPTAIGNVFSENWALGNAGYDLADYPPGPCVLNTWTENEGQRLYDGCEEG